MGTVMGMDMVMGMNQNATHNVKILAVQLPCGRDYEKRAFT